ncbi:MAG: branched-chain amino acid aminotransferase [Bacteroidetes bacterium]|nr:branched-chain amino acid aminotransferase [Bacteroidota bacterium]HET6243917.1 branched-chain amino acid aminotransferase [Bacteroidia bacterium]
MYTDISSNIPIDRIEKSRIGEVDFDKLQFGKMFSDHMFVSDYIDGAWKNSRISPYKKLELSPSSAVIHYGQSIFEGMKAYKNANGEIMLFRPIDNFKRLNKSAERMCMPVLPEEIFIEGLKQLILVDSSWIPTKEEGSLYIRPFMFASDEFIGIRPSDTYKFMIITSPVENYYTEPVKVLVENNYTRAVEGGVGFVKAAGNYGRSLYPAKIAQEKGYHQLIWTDAIEHKYIEESGTMNVMFVIGDTLVTPPTSTTILSGITRDSVLTLAKDWGIKVEERRINIDELVEASEKGILNDAFGTGTAATIAHIELICYKGVDFHLPPVIERKFSNKVKETLQKIRKGNAADKHNWVVKLN